MKISEYLPFGCFATLMIAIAILSVFVGIQKFQNSEKQCNINMEQSK